MPRRGLDQDAVIQAAIQLLNEEGTAALSLQRLAERLGVRTPSLYNHISGLPGLVQDLAVCNTRMLGERMTNAVIGKSGPTAVIEMAEAYRSYIKEYPNLYQLSLRASGNLEVVDPALQAAEEKIVQVAVAVISSFELSGEDAVHAVRGLRSLVHGFATLEVSGGFGIPLDIDESFRRLLVIFIQGISHPVQVSDA